MKFFAVIVLILSGIVNTAKAQAEKKEPFFTRIITKSNGQTITTFKVLGKIGGSSSGPQKAVLLFLINGKSYDETEIGKLDAAEYKNSDIKSGMAYMYTIEGRNMDLYTFLFWIGEAPSLTGAEKNRRAFNQEYTGKTVIGVIKNLTFSDHTHLADGFILESNNRLFKIPTNNPDEAKRLMKMLLVGDIVIINVSRASLLKDGTAVLTPAVLIKDGERLIEKGSVQI